MKALSIDLRTYLRRFNLWNDIRNYARAKKKISVEYCDKPLQ